LKGLPPEAYLKDKRQIVHETYLCGNKKKEIFANHQVKGEMAMLKRGILYIIMFLLITGCFHTPDTTNNTYRMIPVLAFQQGSVDDETWDFGHISAGGGFGAILAGNPPYDVKLYAPVNLPHGAMVTELTAYYLDKSSDDISSLHLSLAYQGSGANFGMASVNVSTTGSLNQIQSASDNSISNPQIDASSNRVWLTLSMTVTSPSIDLRFYGARIKY
jgi:hypothetical protein